MPGDVVRGGPFGAGVHVDDDHRGFLGGLPDEGLGRGQAEEAGGLAVGGEGEERHPGPVRGHERDLAGQAGLGQARRGSSTVWAWQAGPKSIAWLLASFRIVNPASLRWRT